MESPPQRQKGKITEEEPAEAAKKMVEFLHKEAKVI
jgi:electron transfer flavoprotein alpha/beta subunit